MNRLWKQEFKADYLQEITAKTGHRKSYSEFLRLFMKGMTGAEATTFLDLLGMHDLQLLKKRSAPS